MFRLLIACVVLAAPLAAQAQTAKTKMTKMSPGEMAAHDQMVAEKRADCTRQSKDKEKKLGFTARRKFVKECVAKAVGN